MYGDVDKIIGDKINNNFKWWLALIRVMIDFLIQIGTNSPPPSAEYNYLVRIINPEQKTKFITKVWHDVHEKFESTQQLKKQLIITFG